VQLTAQRNGQVSKIEAAVPEGDARFARGRAGERRGKGKGDSQNGGRNDHPHPWHPATNPATSTAIPSAAKQHIGYLICAEAGKSYKPSRFFQGIA
jgi:hypothetical protein